jgi:hypothetical protein
MLVALCFIVSKAYCESRMFGVLSKKLSEESVIKLVLGGCLERRM